MVENVEPKCQWKPKSFFLSQHGTVPTKKKQQWMKWIFLRSSSFDSFLSISSRVGSAMMIDTEKLLNVVFLRTLNGFSLCLISLTIC